MQKEIKELDSRIADIRKDTGEELEPKDSEEEEEELEEDSPDESEEDEESDKKTPEEDDSEDEEESLEDKSSSQPRGRTKEQIRSDYNLLRSQKRSAEAAKVSAEAKAKELLERVTTLTSEVETLKKNAPPPVSFIEAAKEMGVEDPQNLKKLYDLFAGEIDKKYGETQKQYEDRIDQLEERLAPVLEESESLRSRTKVEQEWENFTPALEQEFPKATKEELKKAHDLMAELAETEEHTFHEMPYIFWKEATRFEEIFGPRKRKTMLPARGAPQDISKKDEGVLPSLEEKSHEAILAASKRMKEIASQGDLSPEGHQRI